MSLSRVAGGGAQLCDLGIRVGEVFGRRLDESWDVERTEPVNESAGVVRCDDQIRVIGGDRFDVRRKTREIGGGSVGWKVRLLVHCDDLSARVDRIEHLGRCW